MFMPKVTIVNEKKDIEVPVGGNLRQEALKAAVQVNFEALDTPGGAVGRLFNCRGMGLCGTCRVLVKKGNENLSPKKGVEKLTLFRMLSNIGEEEEARLACQATIKGDCSIQTRPGLNWDGENFWQKPFPNK
jgi:ferredoxin